MKKCNKLVFRTVFRCLFLIVLSIGILSNTYSQSKEETIQWIFKKLSRYKNNSYTICCNGCFHQMGSSKIVYVSTSGFGVNESFCTNCSDEMAVVIEFDKVTQCQIKYDCNGDAHILLNGTFSRFGLYPNPRESNAVKLILPWHTETDLLNRTFKAFSHLAELNQPKETF